MNAILSEDAETVARIDGSLRAFLDAVARGEITEDHITREDQDQHAFFMRVLRSVARSEPPEPLLLKCYPANEQQYLITAAFLREAKQGTEIDKVIEFLAYPHGDGYWFKSPFEHWTRSLSTTDVGDVRYHSKRPIDTHRAEAFLAFKQNLASLIGIESEPIDYYKFDTLDELLKAYGVVYDATKCNWLTHDLGFMNDDGRLFVTGTGDERYIFEFTEDFIARHCDQNEGLYPPFVTGMAVYYGGYALSADDMPTLKAQFRAELARRPGIDFLEEFRKARGSSINRHFTHYVISALISEEVIERHGFDAALRIARSGRSGDRFFGNIEEILGVDESGFHAMVLRLIDASV